MGKEETWNISLKLCGYHWMKKQSYSTPFERVLTHSTNMYIRSFHICSGTGQRLNWKEESRCCLIHNFRRSMPMILTLCKLFFNQIHTVELSSSRYEDWIGYSFKRSWKCLFRLYIRSLEERVGFIKLEYFTALFNLRCPTQVTRTVGIKSGYTHVDCNALKYCTIQYLVFVEIKFRTELSCVITHAIWPMKVACLSDTLVATYSLLILILICTAF